MGQEGGESQSSRTVEAGHKQSAGGGEPVRQAGGQAEVEAVAMVRRMPAQAHTQNGTQKLLSTQTAQAGAARAACQGLPPPASASPLASGAQMRGPWPPAATARRSAARLPGTASTPLPAEAERGRVGMLERVAAQGGCGQAVWLVQSRRAANARSSGVRRGLGCLLAGHWTVLKSSAAAHLQLWAAVLPLKPPPGLPRVTNVCRREQGAAAVGWVEQCSMQCGACKAQPSSELLLAPAGHAAAAGYPATTAHPSSHHTGGGGAHLD